MSTCGEILVRANRMSEPAYDRLAFIEAECLDVRCIPEPTAGGDDAEIGWIVIEHHMAKPHERRVGYGRTPAEAIDDARRNIEHRCIACDERFRDGDKVYENLSGGTVHAACCGTDPASFVDLETGEPIGEGQPIPTPGAWSRDR